MEEKNIFMSNPKVEFSVVKVNTMKTTREVLCFMMF